MSAETDHDHSLTGAYVANALDALERVRFERHLDSCAACRAEVEELRDVVASLAEAETVAPPASLRGAVLAKVAATAPAPSPLAGSGAARTSPFRRRLSRLAVAASAVLAIGAAVGIGLSSAQNAGDAAASGLERDIVMLASAPDAHSMDVDLGTTHVVMSERLGELAIMGHDAPMPKPGMEYQLWLIRADGTASPGLTFLPADDGEVMAIASASFTAVAGFVITEEPAGGSSQPSGAVVASIDL